MSPIISPLGTFTHNFAHSCILNGASPNSFSVNLRLQLGLHADDTPDKNGCTDCTDDWSYRTINTIVLISDFTLLLTDRMIEGAL